MWQVNCDVFEPGLVCATDISTIDMYILECHKLPILGRKIRYMRGCCFVMVGQQLRCDCAINVRNAATELETTTHYIAMMAMKYCKCQCLSP